MTTMKLFAAAMLFAAGAAQAVEIPALRLTRVSDGTTQPSGRGSEPDQFRTVDGVLYFSAAAPGLGTELYRTDGTPGGLRLVRDFAPGPASSNPVVLGKAGGRIIVFANDGVHGRQFWALESDGTATRISADSFSDAYTNLPTPVGNAGDRLLVQMPGFDGQVWSTDGTMAGTYDLGRAAGRLIPTSLTCQLGGSLVLAFDGYVFDRRAILRTDGTPAGTVQIGTLRNDVYLRGVGADTSNGRCRLLYSGGAPSSPSSIGWTLYESDGTAAGTVIGASEATGMPTGIASLGETVYLRIYDDTNIRLLRRAPGATAFTGAVQLPMAQGYGAGGLWRLGNGLAFGGPYPVATGVYASGVFVTDGTQGGTRRVYPLTGSNSGWSGRARPVLGGLLLGGYGQHAYLGGITSAATPLPVMFDAFFDRGDTVGGVYVAYGSDAAGSEVWRTDGTAAGTGRLYDIWPATVGSIASGRRDGLVIGDVVYVTTASINGSNNTVLRSDGTANGLRRLPPGAHAPGVVEAIQPLADGIAFKVVVPPSYAGRWYRADAMLAGATPISEANLAQSYESMSLGDRVIFGCDRPPVFGSLCAAGGGTSVETLYPSIAGVGTLQPVGNVGGAVVFMAGSAVWRSDGTTAGTYVLDAATPSVERQLTSAGLPFQGKLYFGICAQDGTACGLLSTDGTLAGTGVVASLPGGAQVRTLAALDGRFVFTTWGNAAYPQLWRSDGTAAGTQLMITVPGSGSGMQLAAVGGKAHFRSDCYGTPCVEPYYVTDGTPAGTRQVALPLPVKSGAGFLAAVGDQALLFACTRPSTGDELCVIDRDGEHVRLLADVFPGPMSSGPGYSLIARTSSGDVYLGLDDGVHGTELWQVHALADALFGDGFE